MHEVQSVLKFIGQMAVRLPPRLLKIEQAAGRRLAQALLMDVDAPPFNRALLDGYAVRATDAVAGGQLKIVGRRDAGQAAECSIAQGQCVAINTGAPLPEGADAVAMVEITASVPERPDYIQLLKAVPVGAGIQSRGSDARAGQAVVMSGAQLTPAALAVAAAAGAHHMWAQPAPVVAILVTGDELVPIDRLPGLAQIRNTNSILLNSLLRQLDRSGIACDVLDLGVAKDDATAIRDAVVRGFAGADVVLVSGGMSMGTRDLVPQVLEELGVQIHIRKVRIKPGKPFIFGTLEGADQSARKYVLGLPGNPVSAFVCCKVFLEPLLRILQGLDSAVPLVPGVCDHALPANSDREFYQPCVLDFTAHPPVVTPLAWKGSADIFTLANAQGLIVHRSQTAARPQGSPVDILLL